MTFSIQSAVLPSSCSWIAMWVMAVVDLAPCQCFSPGGIQTTSPGRISLMGPPHRCARPQPAITMSVWPSGWVCHAVRAPGSNVTLAPTALAGSFAWNRGSMRTAPLKYSAAPLVEGCEPLRLMSTLFTTTHHHTFSDGILTVKRREATASSADHAAQASTFMPPSSYLINKIRPCHRDCDAQDRIHILPLPLQNP